MRNPDVSVVRWLNSPDLFVYFNTKLKSIIKSKNGPRMALCHIFDLFSAKYCVWLRTENWMTEEWHCLVTPTFSFCVVTHYGLQRAVQSQVKARCHAAGPASGCYKYIQRTSAPGNKEAMQPSRDQNKYLVTPQWDTLRNKEFSCDGMDKRSQTDTLTCCL